jgi:hypothetical protein
MFWQSVWEGFRLLAFWQVWIGVLFYVVGLYAYLFALSKMVGGEKQAGRLMAGCLTNLIAGLVVEGVLTAVVVAFLLPIMLGGERALALSDISSYFGQIALAGTVGVATAILIGLIPVVGRMLTDAPGVPTFIIGVVVFRLLAGPAVQDILARAGRTTASIYPSVWLSLGYIGIAVVFVSVTTHLAALLATRWDKSSGGVLTAVIPPAVGVLGGLLPLFMYSAYVTNALLRAIGR